MVRKKFLLLALVALGSLGLMGYFGYCFGRLIQSSELEKAYPSELARYATQENVVNCSTVDSLQKNGKPFLFEEFDGGQVIRLVSYDKAAELATVSILDQKHRQFVDTFSLKCSR